MRRRELLVGTAGLLASSACFRLGLKATASYDEVLDALDSTEMELDGGSNHAPMAAETLVALGRADRVASWVEQYATRLSRASKGMPEPLAVAVRTERRADISQRWAWAATFQARLDEGATPTQLIQEAWPLVGSGLAGAGWHGLLRAAHAFRAVERAPSVSTRHELANGLGFWAARFLELPGTPGLHAQTGVTVAQALETVPMAASKVKDGLIADQLSAVASIAEFAAAVERVDLTAQTPESALSSLLDLAARLYVNDGTDDIVLLHAITGTAAVRLLFPALSETQRREAVGFAFRAAAAAHATRARGREGLAATAAASSSEDALVAIASKRDDEHDVKLVEACAREVRAGGAPSLLAAAQRRLKV